MTIGMIDIALIIAGNVSLLISWILLFIKISKMQNEINNLGNRTRTILDKIYEIENVDAD